MNFKTFLTIFSFLLLSSFFIISCAGTRGEEDDAMADESSAQQDDLDDIEKLLGITSTETTKEEPKKQPRKTTPKKKNDEKLKLLDTNELTGKERENKSSAYMAAAQSQADKKADPKQVQNLKKELQQKEREINDLRGKIEAQDDELQRLYQSKSSPGLGSISGPIGGVGAGEYESRYEEGRAAFEGRDYRTALQLFESLLASTTNHSLADNAQFWIGECHYGLREYNAAIIAFEKVFTFPKSNKKDDAQFKLGLCYIRKGDQSKAREEFNRLLSDYPNSEYASRAQSHLAKL